jgi:AraC-like DNA-binding protein
MFVSRKAMNNFFKDYPLDEKAVRKSARAMEVEPVALPKDDYLRHFISSLELTSTGGASADEHISKLKFDELMIYLLRRDLGLAPYFQSLCTEWDEDAELRKVVNIHIQSSITVEELAFLCNMSLSTFKRKFARVFGDAPKQWFFKMRMQRAADLLKGQGLKASQIYEQLGYENLSSFVQAFRKFHGLTPKQFQMS